MKPLQNPMTKLTLDGQLYTGFDQRIRQAIGDYVPLESKTPAELHEALKTIRQSLVLPPWHNITLYMKLEARRSVTGAGEMWINTCLDKASYTNEVQDPKTWIWLNVYAKTKEGEQFGPQLAAVYPSGGVVWSCSAEKPIKPNTWSMWAGATGTRTSVGISTKWMIRKATEFLDSGKTAADGPQSVLYTPRRRSCQENTQPAAPVKQEKQEQPKPVLKPIEVKSVIFTEDAEMLLTMCDVACQKLKEIGCEETAKRWKQRVYKLVGKESNE